jgi:hypothetical protein
MATKAEPYRVGRLTLPALTGRASGSLPALAAHLSDHGQSGQAGRFGVQIVAPRSIKAWA